MKGRAVQTTAPAGAIITTAEAKTHLRVDHSNDDDYIDDLVAAATAIFERETHRQLYTATRKYYLDDFQDVIYLPYGEVQSVVTVQYYDTDGNQQTVTNTDYDVAIEGSICRIIAKESWPTTDTDTLHAVEVLYTSGYGVAADVPADIKAALKVIVGDLYNKREDFKIKGGFVDRVIQDYKIYFSD